MRFKIILILLISALQLNAQEVLKLHRTLQWREQPQKITFSDFQTRDLPYFDGANYPADSDYLPVYFETLPLRLNGTTEVSITNAVYLTLNKQLYSITEENLQEGVAVNAQKGFIKKQPVASLSLIPLRKNPMTGEIEKLIEFDLEIRTTPDQQSFALKQAQSYATNSVLKTGRWYKIAVSQDGIYRVDYNFLKNIGLDVDNIDPRNFRIYGNGGGMLSEKNADFRHDDLAENAISVVGESDGSFDASDYILFYGQEPHRWKYDATGQRFHHQTNLYSDVTYYFITADLGPAKSRWSPNASLNNPTVTVTDCDDYRFHELEESSLIGSGREWFGDYYNFSVTTKLFPFSFPNLLTSEPVYLKSSVAARSTASTGYFYVLANGQTVNTHTLTKVGTNYTDIYARVEEKENTFTSSGSTINVSVNFNNPSSGAEGWLNYLELNVRRNLVYAGIPLIFRDSRSVGAGNKAEFVIQNPTSGLIVLDVTDPVNVFIQQYSNSGSEARFTVSADSLREFLAFVDGAGVLIPTVIETVSNQDLHAIGQPDMLIVTPASLKSEADALANHHRSKNNLTVSVVDVNHIYNEFSSGAQDLSAIRDFVRMLYMRAGSDTSLIPRFLLLFGDGSYDYKDKIANNTNLVPSYQSPNSVNPTTTFVTDDFFGFLDDSEGGSIDGGANYLDISIGRLPAKIPEEARAMVNKIIHYQSTGNTIVDPSNCVDGDCSVFGNWRNNITFIGDDEDGNIHMRQADDLAEYLEINHPEYSIDKILLDAYPEQSTPGGSRYPDVNEAIGRKIFSGTLIMNYTGHGGVNGWAHERILDISGINSWNNFCKMPLFITATCEFSRFDDPEKVSAGEMVLLNPNGGAIAMVTTTRLVYSGANFTLNNAFLQKAFAPFGNRMPTIGEAIMLTKNSIGLDANNRKFILLGDPAVMLAYPQYNIATTQVNEATAADDTLKALKKITVTGEVRDNNNVKMTAFNGTVFPTIYDKSVPVTTLKNSGGSAFTFNLQKSVIYNGKASVTNGEFTFTFIVPKDIAYNFGSGKISYYSENGQIDANGYSNVVIGGTATDFETDLEGPQVDVFMNNEKFAFGGITDENPILLVKLTDFSGINTVGTGIGHDITGLLDENSQNTLVLNEYYEAELDNYQAGEARYPLANLENGRHTIAVKAWDVHNNSAEGYTEFVVADDAELALSHVMNYPNPFTTNTSFFFEHNCPCKELFVSVKIMTVSGKVVKTLEQQVLSDGYRADGIQWDGLDEYGEIIGRGVYVYKLNVRTPDGASAHEFEKLVILR